MLRGAGGGAGLCPPWPVSSIMESNLMDILEHHPKASASPGKRILRGRTPGCCGLWERGDAGTRSPCTFWGWAPPQGVKQGGTGVAGAGSRRLGQNHPLETEPAAAPPRSTVSPGAGTAGRGGAIPPLRKSAFPTGKALNVPAARPRAGLRMTGCGPDAGTRGRGDAGTRGQAPGRWQEALARSWHRSGLRGLFIASLQNPTCTECSDPTISKVINNNN